MSEWQPIESAPSGEVLLFWPAKVTGNHQQARLPARMAVGRTYDTPFRMPTHWMPLPDPPSAVTAPDAELGPDHD